MELLLSLVLNIVLLAVLIYMLHAHAKERQDLYNRIMSRGIKEYVAQQNKTPPKSRNFVRRGIEKGREEVGGE